MKVVVVGASGTVGSAAAELIASKHEVIKASRSADMAVDSTDPARFKNRNERARRVDAVVCCAGGGAMKPLTELTDEELEATLGNKLMGQVNRINAVSPRSSKKPLKRWGCPAASPRR